MVNYLEKKENSVCIKKIKEFAEIIRENFRIYKANSTHIFTYTYI